MNDQMKAEIARLAEAHGCDVENEDTGETLACRDCVAKAEKRPICGDPSYPTEHERGVLPDDCKGCAPATEEDQPFVAHELTSWSSRGDGRTYSLVSGREITEPLRLSEQNGTTLRHALKGHGLAVSGTKRQQAVRLANSGVTAAHVEAWHTWRGRDAAPCAHPVTPPGTGGGA